MNEEKLSKEPLRHRFAINSNPSEGHHNYSLFIIHQRIHSLQAPRAYSVAAMTALMVCMRFSAWSKTMDCAPSNTWSVTSMDSRPKAL